MSNNISDSSNADEPPPRLRYTLLLLNEHNSGADSQSLLAADDEEAFAFAEAVAGGQPFELWLGFRFVSWNAEG